jgi:hypothetical protein
MRLAVGPRLLLAFGLGAAAALPQQDPRPVAERVAVEVAVDRPRVFVGEAVEIRLRVRIEERFVREQLIQPFRRALDLPLSIDAPWWDGFDGAAPDSPVPVEDGGASLVLNGALVRARRLGAVEAAAGRELVFELGRRFRILRSGRLSAAPTRLGLSFATRFRDDFLSGRVPDDRHELEVSAAPGLVEAAALPVVGRPPGFGGAVGRFTVVAAVDRVELEVGATLRLTLTIDGAGNFEQFESPTLDGLDGFHPLGRIEEREAGRRRLHWDLRPLRAGVGVPGLAFSYFDPEAGGSYRTLRTAPIALVVGGVPSRAEEPEPGPPPVGPEPAGPSAVEPADRDDIHGLLSKGARPPTASHAVHEGAGLVLLLLSPWLAALGWSCVRANARRRRARRGDGARAAFVAAVARGEAGTGFVTFLAARLGRSEAAVLAPDLRARLTAAGLAADRAGEVAALVEALVAARHGGDVPAPAAERLVALVEALERELPGRTGGAA